MSGIKAQRFLGPDEIKDAIRASLAIATPQNIRLALIGGVAMQVYGSDRLTRDADFVASDVPVTGGKEKPLSFGGIKTEIAGIPVDFIVRDDDYKDLYDEALNTAIKSNDEPKVLVIRPEYLAATKLAARRDKDELDVKKLIALNVLDLDKTRDIIKRHLGKFAMDEFDSLVSEVSWKLSRGEEI